MNLLLTCGSKSSIPKLESMDDTSSSLLDLMPGFEEEDKEVSDTMIVLRVLMNYFPFVRGTNKAISKAM